MLLLSRVFTQLTILLFYSYLNLGLAQDPSSNQAGKLSIPQQLATVFRDDIVVKDYWISEKLDGIRARWDGSQLTTRSGKVIAAPAWFVDGFPARILEGELWLARTNFEPTASIILRDKPNQEWQKIKFMLFDLPDDKGTFTQRYNEMQRLVDLTSSPYLRVIPQFRLTSQTQLMDTLDELVAQGAEGLMLHHQDALYLDGRQAHLLKLKKYQDAEATVIAHILGKGKYQSMLGSLLVELADGKQFKIGSGFTDMQRLEPPPVGSVVTFKYYGLTARGIPRFASFLHITPDN